MSGILNFEATKLLLWVTLLLAAASNVHSMDSYALDPNNDVDQALLAYLSTVVLENPASPQDFWNKNVVEILNQFAYKNFHPLHCSRD